MNCSVSYSTINGSDATNHTCPQRSPSGIFVEPPPMRWTLRMIFILIFLVGMVGNSVVCAAVIRRKRMRTSNNIFTFNLAFSDLLTVVIYVPSQMTAFENNHNWLLGEFACHVAYTTIPMCMSASIMTLLAITLDRYRAIANPMKPRLTMRTVKIILACIWVTSVVIVLPLAYVAGEISPTPDTVYCDESWPDGPYSEMYWLFIFAIQYVLPLGIIMVLASLIALKIRQNSAEMVRSSNQLLAAARQRMRQTSKITNMLIALVILYAVCMLPQHIVYLWLTYGNLGQSKYKVYVLRFSNVFPMANSAFNPFAYGLNKEFKQAFESFFKCEYSKPKSLQRNAAGSFQYTPRKFPRNAVYRNVEETMSKVWRRKSSATSLFGKSAKTALWKEERRRENSRVKADGTTVQEITVQNGEAGPKLAILNAKKTPSETYPEREATISAERSADSAVSISLGISSWMTSDNTAPLNGSKKSPSVIAGEQGSSEDETTSLLSKHEIHEGRGILHRQHGHENKETLAGSMIGNTKTKSAHEVLYLDGPKVKSETSDDRLTYSCIESCVKVTLNKPDEELAKFIQSLEETYL